MKCTLTTSSYHDYDTYVVSLRINNPRLRFAKSKLEYLLSISTPIKYLLKLLTRQLNAWNTRKRN